MLKVFLDGKEVGKYTTIFRWHKDPGKYGKMFNGGTIQFNRPQIDPANFWHTITTAPDTESQRRIE